MAIVSCPKCRTGNIRAGYPVWVIVVAVLAFPFGLFALLAPRRPTYCQRCGFLWTA